MICVEDPSVHERVWLLLPWLATGRIAQAEREEVEEHVRHCSACERELALQQLMCRAFAEPDRVTYAPGPSFRKLLDRIEDAGTDDVDTHRPRQRPPRIASRSVSSRLSQVSLWRPPGLAWAASFLLLFGVTGLVATAYRWSEPVYRTHTQTTAATPNVLHVALDRSLRIREVEEMLRASGARIVEGPGNTGVFGITPVGLVSGQTSETAASRQMRELAARLRADPRVLWVQPLAQDEMAPIGRSPAAQEH